MSIYNVIGLMSGTSLDGVDMLSCVFDKKEGKWEYKINKCITVEYDKTWRKKLSEAHQYNIEQLTALDFEYGHYLGKLTAAFIQRQHLRPNLVASHGHTILHNPTAGYTLQIGNGAALASHINCPLVFDFRAQDVAMGGQGAPLVPMGDELLFAKYADCVNLGGIANISLLKNNERIAWDIGVCNMALNYLTQKIGEEYDEGGRLAAKGTLIPNLLQALDKLKYYILNAPKSMGREFFELEIIPLFNQKAYKVEDLLHTWVIHISHQIAETLKGIEGTVLFTGGGAFNDFLMSEIKSKIDAAVYIPNSLMVGFKEALIFAFLGALRMDNEINILASVTGASKNHSSGSIIY